MKQIATRYQSLNQTFSKKLAYMQTYSLYDMKKLYERPGKENKLTGNCFLKDLCFSLKALQV